MNKIHLVLIFAIGFLHAQTARKYSNAFMSIGVDAAAMAQANTVVASAMDATATYWNPSGLTRMESSQIAAMHANYFGSIAQYDYLAYAAPIDQNKAWGISMIRFGVDDIMDTTELIDAQGNVDYNRIKLFSAVDYGVVFSYAQRLPLDGLRWGINTKVIRRIIGDFANAWGFGMDFGLQFDKGAWQFGLMARDITTTYNQWSINQKAFEKIQNATPGFNQTLPDKTEITLPKLQLGVSRLWDLHNEYTLRTSASLDVEFYGSQALIHSRNLSLFPAIGVEGGFEEMVFLRAGIGNFQFKTNLDNTKSLSLQPNAGVGFALKNFQLDYALTNLGGTASQLYSHIFSFKWQF